MRLNLDILESAGCLIKELRWVGGGDNSKILAQLKANVMNKIITMLNVKEAGCYGVAMLACSVDTGRPINSLTSGWMKESEVVYPQLEHVKFYKERYEAYKKLYENVRSISF